MPVERDYHLRWQAFLLWFRLALVPFQSNADIDDASPAMMNEMFFEGLPGTDAKKLLAALGYWIPSLTRGSPELVKAQSSAVGWKKLSPASSRLPTPWPVACLILNQLMLMGHRMAAQAAALTWCGSCMCK